MNSFNFAAKGIEREIARQIEIYESGGEVEQETLHFVPGRRGVAADALQGGGAGLPLLPGAGPRAGASAGGDRRAPARRDRRAARRADPAHRRDALVLRRGRARRPAVSTGSGPTSSPRAPTRRRRRTCSRTSSSLPGVEPGAVDSGELAKLVAARGGDPARVFDEALAKVGDDGFSADPYLAQKAVSDVSELDPVIDRVLAANPGAGRAVPRRQGGPARLLRRRGDEGDAAARPTRASSTSACARSSASDDPRPRFDLHPERKGVRHLEERGASGH